MITDSEVLKVYSRIRTSLARQGIEATFKIIGDIHQCRLSFDSRVLFESADYKALPDVYQAWGEDEARQDVGKFIAPF